MAARRQRPAPLPASVAITAPVSWRMAFATSTSELDVSAVTGSWVMISCTLYTAGAGNALVSAEGAAG